MYMSNLALNNTMMGTGQGIVYAPANENGRGILKMAYENKDFEKYKILGWDVDTQRDFMEEGGKLAIAGAMDIAPKLGELTQYLRNKNIPIFGSVDWHPKDAYEFPKNGEEPDFANTFPEHCVKNTYGSQKIDATAPLNPLYIDYEKGNDANKLAGLIREHDGEVIFRKDRFDVFDPNGNPYAKDVLKNLGVEKALVYGVALEVCNNFAVRGLLDQGIEVYAIEDAMRAINEDVRPAILGEWKRAGAKIINLENVLKGQY